ncbi:hypothetical protein THRCLA_10483 [Thraustotheca clavata]|uniref:Ion transport domain-containing protein n=1 Tax=Thraustotheca clavata TaxID=74557 RepID=A0A1V9YNI0_9STRA|nr:hypothetical protein THRCLA_10483 [Thraustotheca clavata]
MDVKSEDHIPQFYVWLNCGPAIIFPLFGTISFEYKTRNRLRNILLLLVIIVLIPLNYFAPELKNHINWTAFSIVNNAVLLITALYFVLFEMNEMFGEITTKSRHDTWYIPQNAPYFIKELMFYTIRAPLTCCVQYLLMVFGNAKAVYFQSYFNCIQLPAFAALVVFSIISLATTISDDPRYLFGIPLTFLLWALGIQYLEVHNTAGYLIPMISKLVHDVKRFLAFYAPFQCAYAFAYYLLFLNCDGQKCDAPAYETLTQSFITTYLVMLQQLDLEPFNQLSPQKYFIGYVLVLTHATLVMVMLLNVLIAIMSKSVDGGLERAKLDALESFAECVVRSEKIAGLATPKDKEIQDLYNDYKQRRSRDDINILGFEAEVDSKDAKMEADRLENIEKIALCGTDNVNTSVLFQILHDPNPKNPLLEHKAIKYIVNFKWEIFGFQMYIQQLLIYTLLLMSLTLAVSMDLSKDSKGPFLTQFYMWLNAGTAILIALIGTYFLKYKEMVKWSQITVLLIAITLCLLNYFATSILNHVNWLAFAIVNSVVLFLTSLFFLKFEVDEMYAQTDSEYRVFIDSENMPHLLNRILFYIFSAPFEILLQFLYMLLGRNKAVYFQSNFNRIQLPTFVVLVFFAGAELIYPITSDYRSIIGILLCFILWALSIQYLEVHATAGYLIPMMTSLVIDIYRFLAFYLPFQCAYAVAYYLLFQHCDDPEAAKPYNTISQSFITTYLVMLQQFDTGAFDALSGAQYLVGYFLLLSHTTLVMVMLLNVLVAMLTNSVEDGLDKAKREAFRSFAECVLRSEKTEDRLVINFDETTPLLSAEVEEDDEKATIESVSDELKDFREGVAVEMTALKTEVADLKNDVAGLKELIQALRNDIANNRN